MQEPIPRSLATHLQGSLDADRCLIISRSSQRIEGRAAAALNLTAAIELLLAQ